MSSGYFRSEIISCDASIAQCKEKINNLQNKISDQENEEKIFLTKKSAFETALFAKKTRKSNIENLSSEMTIAKKYNEYLEEAYQKENENLNKLSAVRQSIKNEISKNYTTLEDYKRELADLQNRLSSLQSEYTHALNREAEEAARAAAEAAATRNTR